MHDFKIKVMSSYTENVPDSFVWDIKILISIKYLFCFPALFLAEVQTLPLNLFRT